MEKSFEVVIAFKNTPPLACGELEVVATTKEGKIIIIPYRLKALAKALAKIFPVEDVVLDCIIHETFELFAQEEAYSEKMLRNNVFRNKDLCEWLYAGWRERYWEKRKLREVGKEEVSVNGSDRAENC